MCLVPGLSRRPGYPRQQASVIEVDLVRRKVHGHAQQHVHAAVAAFYGVACAAFPSVKQLLPTHPEQRERDQHTAQKFATTESVSLLEDVSSLSRTSMTVHATADNCKQMRQAPCAT